MPSAAAMARSSGVVMKPRTRSALAPMYAVRTVTVALSSLGYWRTLSVRIACNPAMMITRLTTIARTGRLTKISVNFKGASPVLRVRVELGIGLDVVVHDDRGAIAKLESTDRDHLLAGLDAIDDGHEVSACFARSDELLPSDLLGRRCARALARRLIFGGRRRLYHEDRVAVRCVNHRRGRDRNDVPFHREHDRYVGEHPRAKLLVLVGERGAELQVTRRRVDGGIDGHQASLGRNARATTVSGGDR